MKRFKLLVGIALLSLSSGKALAQQYEFPFQNPDLPIEERVEDLVARMTLEEKMLQMRNSTPAIERLGVCAYDWWNEALHGVARVKKMTFTVYPQAIGMAASFNAPLLQEVASSISSEGRALFNKELREGTTGTRYRGLTYWTPNINIFRDPRWGRGQETYGEDPFLAGAMGSAMVHGLQGDDEFYLKSSACAKHYAVHSGPEHNRHVFNSVVNEFDLWDTYLPAFKELVKEAKVSGVMGAYNRLNGVPCSGDPFLLDDILRESWGFNGYVTSDCGGVRDLYKYHKTHANEIEAATAAIKAGTDLECGNVYKNLPQAIAENALMERDINKAVKRLFEIRMRLGMFDPAERDPYSQIGLEVIECDEHKALAEQIARESMVLLQNRNNTLPLNKDKVKSIAVIGPNADNKKVLKANYFGTSAHTVTALEGIQKKFDKAKIVSLEGCGHISPLVGVSTKEIAAQAKKCDVIIYVGGISADYEGEDKKDDFGADSGFARGDRTSIALPEPQLELLKELKKTRKPVIFVNMSGSAISMEWEDENLDAIIQAWYGGQSAGTAIADVIAGDYNPSGRMPITIYKSDADLPDFEDYSMTNRTYRYFKGDVRYPFGYGLSYTTFAYDNIAVPAEVKAGESLKVSAQVTNSGSKDGDESVQLYVVHNNRTTLVPNCALKGFQKVSLKAGESKTVEFTLRPQDLALVDQNGNTIMSEGDVEIFIGGGQPTYASSIGGATKIVGGAYQIQ